ncbi:class I SAM-dependent methyltransferase [Nocardioides xinjiangensis]|uniref:class I SAM-dependent methyltransferase n=1 Tax=Nocardioides xinjiangensis TaxID=2817376 RepID=UPI001B301939|nr:MULTISPECIES: class I SAM-dependent methyltransferase [unclassified Nocardioides]
MSEPVPPHAVYTDEEVVAFYSRFEEQRPAELAWVQENRELLGESRVLDLGVGAGRTTPLLMPLSRTYVGVDYSPPLVHAARERFPDADLRVGDARSMPWIEPASIDVVVFSFNGIDTMGSDDRALVLAEVFRVLRPGGWFLFSSHNQDAHGYRRLARFERPRLSRVWLKRTARRLSALARHARMRRDEVFGDGWSIINDEAHDYRLMHFYATKEYQEQALAGAGFELAQVYRQDGRHWTGPDTESLDLHYWCWKRG